MIWSDEKRAKRKDYMQRWRKANRKKWNRWAIENYHKNKVRWSAARAAYGREYNARVKTDVLTHYGKGGTLTCNWPDCQVSDLDMLTLDHIGDNGAKHRKEVGGGGISMYCWIRKNKYPAGFQTLCANHQFKKEMLRKRAVRKT